MPLAPGTIAFYPLAVDGSDAGGLYNLAMAGAVPFGVVGGNASAGQFSDLNYFTFPAGFITAWNAVTAGNAPWCIEFFAYPHDITNFPEILSSQSAVLTYLQVHATLGSRLVCNNNTSAGFTYPLQTHLDTWLDFAFSYDGTTLNFYINNALQKANVQPGIWGVLTLLKLGRDLAAGAFFKGNIYGLRFSNINRTNFPTVDPTGADNRKRRMRS